MSPRNDVLISLSVGMLILGAYGIAMAALAWVTS